MYEYMYGGTRDHECVRTDVAVWGKGEAGKAYAKYDDALVLMRTHLKMDTGNAMKKMPMMAVTMVKIWPTVVTGALSP